MILTGSGNGAVLGFSSPNNKKIARARHAKCDESIFLGYLASTKINPNITSLFEADVQDSPDNENNAVTIDIEEINSDDDDVDPEDDERSQKTNQLTPNQVKDLLTYIPAPGRISARIRNYCNRNQSSANVITLGNSSSSDESTQK